MTQKTFSLNKDNDSSKKSKQEEYENFNNSQISPIVKVDENSTESEGDKSAIEKDHFRVIQITQSQKKTSKTKKASLIKNNDINLKVSKTIITSSSKKSDSRTLNFEGNINKIFSSEPQFKGANDYYNINRLAKNFKEKFLIPETVKKLKQCNIKLKNFFRSNKRRREFWRKEKKKRTIKSPITAKSIRELLPNIKRRNRSKSPMMFEFDSKSKFQYKNMLKAKYRRKSTETKYSTTKSKSRKKSPILKKSPTKLWQKRKMKAKSPKHIVPPPIEINLGKMKRDSSMVLLLRLNFKVAK
jgi:hypothetical protein